MSPPARRKRVPRFHWEQQRGTEAHHDFQTAEYAGTIPLHRHSYFEVFLIRDGVIQHHINDQSELLSAGALVLIRPDDLHCLRPYRDQPAHFINLEFAKKSMAALFDYLGPGFERQRLLAAPMPPQRLLDNVDRSELEQRLNGLHALRHDEPGAVQLALRTLLFDLCVRHFRPMAQPNELGRPRWLARVCTEMQRPNNLVEGVDRLVALSGKRHPYVCRAFRKHLGLTPSDFVNDLRLNYTANLLRHTDGSISDIAYGAGYNNLGYFYRLFNRRYGTTPQRFRDGVSGR